MLSKGYGQDQSGFLVTSEGIPKSASHYKPVKKKTELIQFGHKDQKKVDQLSDLIRSEVKAAKSEEEKVQSPWAKVGIPGLDHVVDKQKHAINRCFWGLIVLACLAVCVYQIYTRIDLFLQYPVAADIRVAQNKSMKFPQITICSADTPDLVKLKERYSKANPQTQNDLDSIDLAQLVGFEKLAANDIWEMTKIPPFGDKLTMQETVGRDETYAVEVVDKPTINGVCKVLKVVDDISYYGPSTELKIEINSSITQIGQNAFWVTLEMDGDQPNFKSMLPIPYGHNMGISIKLKQFQALNTPAHQCVDAATSINCLNLCLIRLQIKDVSCKLPFMKRNNLKMCVTAAEAIETYSKVQELIYNLNLSMCNCLPKCYYNLYTASREIFEVKREKTTLFFYYSTNQIEILHQSFEYSLFSLLCDIGGNLGLYLGLSILSLFEIFESLNKI